MQLPRWQNFYQESVSCFVTHNWRYKLIARSISRTFITECGPNPVLVPTRDQTKPSPQPYGNELNWTSTQDGLSSVDESRTRLILSHGHGPL